LKCPPLPKSKCAAFWACESFRDVYATLHHAKEYLSEILVAFEFMDADVLKLVAAAQENTPKMPFGSDDDNHLYP
jgi:hypothetical protein